MTSANLRLDVARHLQRRLEAFRQGFRQNLALIGPPGSGKTFQLQALAENSSSSLRAIYCPLYRESCRSFLQRFLSAILQAALPLAPALASQGDDLSASGLSQLLEQVAAQCPQTALAARAAEQLIARRLYGEAFNRVLDVIPALAEESHTPCVLIIDEFLYLEEVGLAHAFHELGKRVMTWPNVLFILSSSSTYRARQILRERLQLLFGQFELVSFGPLDATTTILWVQQELRGLRHTAAASSFLVEWLASYPWYLGVWIRRLRERATLGKQAELNEALFLQVGWDLLGAAEGPLYQWCLARLEGLLQGRLGSKAQDVLVQIALGARTATDIAHRTGKASVSEALQCLVEHDLVQRNGMCWMVADPILRCWVASILAAQRANAVSSPLQLRDRLSQTLRGLWGQWTQTHQLSLASRVAQLLTQFDDDTVSLDAKTGRLPRFAQIQPMPPVPAPGQGAYLVAEGEGKRWCLTVHERSVDEQAITQFDAFCRQQQPRPSRKVLVARIPLDEHMRMLAKAANMWVWEPQDLRFLTELYGRP
jgi:hypothetical protein